MTTQEQKKAAIKAYKELTSGKVGGMRIKPIKVIKVGSITFID